MKPFVYTEPDKYRVVSKFTYGLVTVYSGNDYEHAKISANYWDEKQDTWLLAHNPPRTALDLAMAKLNALSKYVHTVEV